MPSDNELLEHATRQRYLYSRTHQLLHDRNTPAMSRIAQNFIKRRSLLADYTITEECGETDTIRRILINALDRHSPVGLRAKISAPACTLEASQGGHAVSGLSLCMEAFSKVVSPPDRLIYT